MNDWAALEVEKLKKQTENKRAKSAEFQERQTLKRECGRSQWFEVREGVKQQCDLFNKAMGDTTLEFFVTQNSELKACGRMGSTTVFLEANFNGDSGPLEWRCGSGVASGVYELEIRDDGTVGFHDKKRTPYPSAPEAVAQEMLSALLNCLGRAAA